MDVFPLSNCRELDAIQHGDNAELEAAKARIIVTLKGWGSRLIRATAGHCMATAGDGATISVISAGTASVNGNYVATPEKNGHHTVYKKIGGQEELYRSTATSEQDGDLDRWVIAVGPRSETTYECLTASDTVPTIGWQRVMGVAPVPSVTVAAGPDQIAPSLADAAPTDVYVVDADLFQNTVEETQETPSQQ